MDFEVNRSDLHDCRTVDATVAGLRGGEALLEVDAFALTSNNITYAVMGDAMKYWDFFPAAEGWGRVPVWGFADVFASKLPELQVGTRVFGYVPPSAHLRVRPGRVDSRGFVDAAEHRAHLPEAYNWYTRADADPTYDKAHEDQHMLLRPLFFTSFLIDDLLDDEGLNAGPVVLSSASSKTAHGTAFLLSKRGTGEVIGLTSPSSVHFVERLGVYDRVVPYDELETLPRERATYVDMAGDAELRARIHSHYGDQLAYSLIVGVTHWDRMEGARETLPGPPPSFFFAPDRLGKADHSAFGPAWREYVKWTKGWLRIVRGFGPQAVRQAYLELLEGRTDPSVGHILSLP